MHSCLREGWMETQSEKTARRQAFRVDVQLHDLLVNKNSRSLKSLLPASGEPQSLPEPVYPAHPELQSVPDPEIFPDKRAWSAPLVYRAMRGWLFPYVRSRAMPGVFHPIIAYLFTEWKCNLDCHYCWAFDNSVKGMTEDIARRSIDWLHDNGCRVLALMGGEPLLRPQFVHKVVYYAAKKGLLDLRAHQRPSPAAGGDRPPGRCRRGHLQPGGRRGGRKAGAAQGAQSDPLILRSPGEAAVSLRIHGVLQHEHLPQ
jgi:sulfatase maturation enzyme AslB (radical SAM superfamily)